MNDFIVWIQSNLLFVGLLVISVFLSIIGSHQSEEYKAETTTKGKAKVIFIGAVGNAILVPTFYSLLVYFTPDDFPTEASLGISAFVGYIGAINIAPILKKGFERLMNNVVDKAS